MTGQSHPGQRVVVDLRRVPASMRGILDRADAVVGYGEISKRLTGRRLVTAKPLTWGFRMKSATSPYKTELRGGRSDRFQTPHSGVIIYRLSLCATYRNGKPPSTESQVTALVRGTAPPHRSGRPILFTGTHARRRLESADSTDSGPYSRADLFMDQLEARHETQDGTDLERGGSGGPLRPVGIGTAGPNEPRCFPHDEGGSGERIDRRRVRMTDRGPIPLPDVEDGCQATTRAKTVRRSDGGPDSSQSSDRT